MTRQKPAGTAALCRLTLIALAATSLVSCDGISFAQRESPANPYKDFRSSNSNKVAVIGMGEPINARQMAANATITLNGQFDLTEVMQKMAGTYNTAIRWGNGARRDKRVDVVMNKLSFDEARNYLEDVYDIQIIKEGERRLLILPSASEPRLASFNPGNNVSLSQAIRGLAEQCNYNLVINENREQLNRIRVTANLKNVTCYDAFDALLTPHGLSLVNGGDYMTIGGLPQRQWTVNLYEPQRSEQVEVNYSSDFSAGSGGSSGGSSSGGGSDGSQSAGGSTKVSVKYERDLWKDLEGDLNELIKNGCLAPLDEGATVQNEASLLPPPTGENQDNNLVQPASNPASSSSSSGSPAAAGETACGYVRINPSVGLIQMRAPKAVLDEANEIITRVQDVASRNYDQRTASSIGGAKGGTTASGSYSGSVTAAVSGMLSSLTTTDIDNVGGFVLKNKSLDAVMALLEKFGTTYELMHPMMELMDRQRATLIDGRNEKYFVVKADTSTSTSGATTSYDIEERTQFLGLQFSATAQISDNPDEPHTVSLQIPITSLAKSIEIPGGGNNPPQGVAPVANTRLIDQKVRIRDGEIKVIGGLTKTIAVDTESGVPLVRDIPALGKLANSEAIQYENVEFVILLQVRRLY
jgi:MSHA biogenesis protein MshL